MVGYKLEVGDKSNIKEIVFFSSFFFPSHRDVVKRREGYIPIVKSCAFITWNEVAKNKAKGRDFGHSNQKPTVRSKTNPPR